MLTLLTGATGFLGNTIKKNFNDIKLTTLGRSNDNDIVSDLSREIPALPKVEYVIHNAGKAHSVPKSLKEEQAFFDVNYKGTINLLHTLEAHLKFLRGFVFMSTVAVYGKETGALIRESEHLAGKTPYALSKIKAEKAVSDWGIKNNIPVLILRLPLIAGKNPPGNLDKMIKGIQSGKYLSINKGEAKRSIVLAEDVAQFIKTNLGREGIYNLTDGYHPTFREIESLIAKQLNKNLPPSISMSFANILGKFGDVFKAFPVNSDTINKMSQDLTFDDTKARQELGWNPRRVIDYFHIS